MGSSHTHKGNSQERSGAQHSPEVVGPEQGSSSPWGNPQVILTPCKPSLAALSYLGERKNVTKLLLNMN